ncbi:MAG: hypothetical protein AAFO07_01715 [Bacteroidota bacterium]
MNVFYPKILSKLLPYILLGLCLVLFLPSCDVINPEEDIPSYLYISDFNLTTSSSQGSASIKASEAWVLLDGEFIGAFPVQSTIPILTTGTHEIEVRAGIRDNGISSSPEIYPFYTSYTVNVDLEANEIDTIVPTIAYRPDARFLFVEGFELSGHLFREVLIGDDNNRIQRTQDDIFEGGFSGFTTIDIDQPEVLLASTSRFRYPEDPFPTIYLEMNYKAEGLLGVGIIGYSSAGASDGQLVFSAGFRPKVEWNKIYFNLSQIFADNNFFEYKIAFQAAIPQEEGTYIQENVTIWLDNIKLIQF